MRISRRLGIFATAKSASDVSIYGAINETITLTHSDGTAYSVTANANGYGGERELPFGTYSVKGGTSGFSKTISVDKYTTRIDAWPTGAYMYFWHGTMPNGGWSSSGYKAGSNITGNSTSSVSTTLTVSASDKYSNGLIGMVNAMDLTGIDKVHFFMTGCTSAPDTYFVISSSKTSATHVIHPSSTSAQMITFDVTNFSGKYYIWFYVHVYDWATYRYAQVSRVYGTVDASGTLKSIQRNIAIGNTYRYANSLIAGTWVPVSSLSFGSINYVGQGTEDYNAMMIPVSAYTYSGPFKRLTLSLYLWTSSSSNHTFRWAVTTSTANAYAYQIGSGVVSDSYQLGQGTFTPPYSDAYQWYTFELSCETVPSGTPLYIYLWRNNTTYGNIHVMNSAVVTLEYTKL